MPELVVMGSGEMLLGPSVVPWVAMAVQRLEREMRRDGMRDREAAAITSAFEQALHRIRTSAAGRPEVPPEPIESCSSLYDPIGTKEAAVILHISDRAVRDQCERGVYGLARRVGSSWQIERAEVIARAERRAG